MFRFDNILEEWAKRYKPLSHDPLSAKTRTFYRLKTINMENAVMRNQNTAKSPCMAYSIVVDAEMKNTAAVSYQHTIYFLSRAVSRTLKTTAKNDEDLGIDQQQMMDEMVRDLLAYLSKMKHDNKDPLTDEFLDIETTKALKGLKIESAQWASMPYVVKFGEWHIMGLQIEQIVGAATCIAKAKYITE